MIGTNEIILILCLLVFLFGANKVIEWARTAGKAKREFENARDDNEEIKK